MFILNNRAIDFGTIYHSKKKETQRSCHHRHPLQPLCALVKYRYHPFQLAGNGLDLSILELVETDDIICDTPKLLIATVFKRKATLVHDRYKNNYVCR
ncbi:hypothetical protein AB4K20DRAFT_1872761 [Rhizopus microsporus]